MPLSWARAVTARNGRRQTTLRTDGMCVGDGDRSGGVSEGETGGIVCTIQKVYMH